MARIYAALIRKGLKTPDDVPARLRDAARPWWQSLLPVPAPSAAAQS